MHTNKNQDCNSTCITSPSCKEKCPFICRYRWFE